MSVVSSVPTFYAKICSVAGLIYAKKQNKKKSRCYMQGEGGVNRGGVTYG